MEYNENFASMYFGRRMGLSLVELGRTVYAEVPFRAALSRKRTVRTK